MNKDVRPALNRNKKIILLKQKIRDEDYMSSAINKIAAELTVFLCR